MQATICSSFVALVVQSVHLEEDGWQLQAESFMWILAFIGRLFLCSLSLPLIGARISLFTIETFSLECLISRKLNIRPLQDLYFLLFLIYHHALLVSIHI